MAGSVNMGGARAAESTGISERRQTGETAQWIDRLASLAQEMGHDLHGEFRQTIGFRRTLVRRSRQTPRSMGQSSESFVARELYLLQSARTHGMAKRKVAHPDLRRHVHDAICQQAGGDATV